MKKKKRCPCQAHFLLPGHLHLRPKSRRDMLSPSSDTEECCLSASVSLEEEGG